MKYLLVATALLISLFVPETTFAQLKKSNWIIEGPGNYSDSEKINYSSGGLSIVNTKSSFISVKSGKFVKDNFMIGLSLSNQKVNEEIFSSTPLPGFPDVFMDNKLSSKENRFSIGTYARFYKPILNELAFFLQGDFQMTHSDLENTAWYLQQVLMRPGVTYFITPHWGASLSYGSIGYESVTKTKLINAEKIGLDFSRQTALFSIQYYIFKNH